MGFAARWIRLGPAEPQELGGTAQSLAALQSPCAQPIVLWGAQAEGHGFALVVPLRFAPGKRQRWTAWALSPAIAAYRHIGLPAYLEGAEIRLHGRRIAHASVALIGACVVAASGFVARFPAEGYLEGLFRARIEAQHGWQFESSWPSAPELAAMSVARGAPQAAVAAAH
jgi:hypothetical protein